MKRLAFCLLSCLILTGAGWLAHSVLAQTAAPAEKTFTVTQSQLDKYVADQVAKAVADHEKGGHAAAGTPVTDEQVLNGANWHHAIFNKAEWVVYTGPGQVMFHHWVEQKAPPKSGAGPSAPPSK